MDIHRVSILCQTSLTACGEDELRRATGPQSIIDVVIDFFSFGGIRRSNERLYQQLYDALSQHCQQVNPEQLSSLPCCILLTEGCYRIEIARSDCSWSAQGKWHTRVTVSSLSDSATVIADLPDTQFVRACEVLSFRAQNGDNNRYAALFTSSGLKNFENLRLSMLRLSGDIYSFASFNNSVIDVLTLKDMRIEASTFHNLHVTEMMHAERILASGLSFCDATLNRLTLLQSEWQCCHLSRLQIQAGNFVSSQLAGCFGTNTCWRGITAEDTLLRYCTLIEPEFSSPYALDDCLQSSSVRGAYYTGIGGKKFLMDNDMPVENS